jgi:DNA-directed RNA polymerase specialized sigma24 family protein
MASPGSSTIILQGFLAEKKNELFGPFVAKYQPWIKRRCVATHGLQDEDADDVTSTIMLRFCHRKIFDAFVLQTKEEFYGWLRVVVTNAVLTFIRDRGATGGASLTRGVSAIRTLRTS